MKYFCKINKDCWYDSFIYDMKVSDVYPLQVGQIYECDLSKYKEVVEIQINGETYHIFKDHLIIMDLDELRAEQISKIIQA